jgi:hypothetical protein
VPRDQLAGVLDVARGRRVLNTGELVVSRG